MGVREVSWLTAGLSAHRGKVCFAWVVPCYWARLVIFREVGWVEGTSGVCCGVLPCNDDAVGSVGDTKEGNE